MPPHPPSRSASPIVETARPKINLTLRVLGRRADGYHELESLVAFADHPADTVTLDPALAPGVEVTGPFAAGIAGINLLQTTLELVAGHHAEVRMGRVLLEKNLPVAAGVGGGSADAAALLRALARANPEIAGQIDWSGIALRLGADVPVCLLDRSAWMGGVGERLLPLGPAGARLFPLHAVLVNPLTPVPEDKTARVFRALRAPPLAAGETAAGAMPASRDALIRLIDGGNDLQRAACDVVPATAAVLGALGTTPGCEVVAMSGAGPTCFGIYPDAEIAARAAVEIAARQPEWWVRAATLS